MKIYRQKLQYSITILHYVVYIACDIKSFYTSSDYDIFKCIQNSILLTVVNESSRNFVIYRKKRVYKFCLFMMSFYMNNQEILQTNVELSTKMTLKKSLQPNTADSFKESVFSWKMFVENCFLLPTAPLSKYKVLAIQRQSRVRLL